MPGEICIMCFNVFKNSNGPQMSQHADTHPRENSVLFSLCNTKFYLIWAKTQTVLSKEGFSVQLAQNLYISDHLKYHLF
jgi:hypothetical protein